MTTFFRPFCPVTVLCCALLAHLSSSSFITPTNLVPNLQTLASLEVSQFCEDEKTCQGLDVTSCLSLSVCHEDKTCNGREDLPPVEFPLDGDWLTPGDTTGSASCVVSSDPPDQLPSSTTMVDDVKTLRVNGSADGLGACDIQRNGSVDSIFTVTFWLKADCENCSVLEMPLSMGKPSVHLRVIGNALCLNNDCQSGLVFNKWLLITVRNIDGTLAVFAGSSELSFPGTDTSNMNIENLYIGSSEIASITDIFSLFYVRYYRGALTLREIEYQVTGLGDFTITFGKCQCPSDYINEMDDLCSDGSSTVPRFNQTVNFYPPDVILQKQSTDNWASTQEGAVTFTLSFKTSFQIERIDISFASGLPGEVSSNFISDGKEKETKDLFCSDKSCALNTATLGSTSSIEDFNKQVADEIKIVMLRQNSTDRRSFIISQLTVNGRCDCNGNAESCNVVDGTYNCSCEKSTNTRGPSCRLCQPNHFRTDSDFDCPTGCECETDGVKDVSSQCDETSGQCICKDNVEGERCDTCKPFTHSLGPSPQGCIECNCYQPGVENCSSATGECTCKPYTVTPRCDACIKNFYGLDTPEGCRACDCQTAGTVSQSGACNSTTGQCNCKFSVEGSKCDTCKLGHYRLEAANLQGCTPCECNQVGIENSTCDTNTGQCLCRGGVITDRKCTPVISSVEPLYGPQIGGTLITIKGLLLGNDTHKPSVFLGDVLQELISVDDSTIIVRTVQHSSLGRTPSLKVSWESASSPVDTNATFLYKANPQLDLSKALDIVSFASGGCNVHIYGSHLDSVQNPKLDVINVADPQNVVHGACRLVASYMVCQTPNMTGLGLSSTDQYQMKIVLDGVTSTQIGNIQVKPDPVLKHAGNIRFQYPFEDTISFSGERLLTACERDGYDILLGVVHCVITSISDTQIECKPPVSPPGDRMTLPVQISIGNIKQNVGTMQYLELHETTGFRIIIGCLAALILIIIGAIIICCVCRVRRGKADLPTTSLDRKDLVPVDNRPTNVYAELATAREPDSIDDVRQPITKSNGFHGVVQMETVFREPKMGIVNSAAEHSLVDDFLPKVEPGLREDVRQCYIGHGHFALGRTIIMKGQNAQLLDGSLQLNGSAMQKLTIKALIKPVTESQLPVWGNLALRECLRLRRHKHTHVLSIVGIGVDQQDRFHILYPQMSQGILKTLIADVSKDFSVRQLLAFSQQVAEGIDFLTSKDITHKDIAARNCMMDEYSIVKLCDASFSWDFYANEYTYDEQRERYLPIRWMAPESISDGYYDMRTDVWSFAVLIWELLTRGCLPFHEVAESSEVSDYIIQGYILGKPDTLSDEVYDLLRSCWAPENETRPTIATVARSLGEMLEAEDDGTYENAGAVTLFRSGKAATPRQNFNGNGNIYSSTNLSKI